MSSFINEIFLWTFTARRRFSAYRILIAPFLYLMNPELEKKITEYVQEGGTLILTMRTGVMNMDNA